MHACMYVVYYCTYNSVLSGGAAPYGIPNSYF